MSEFGTLLFRSAFLLLVLAWIWWLIGPELMHDAKRIGVFGSDMVNSDIAFADYPVWLQVVLGFLGGFAVVVCVLVLRFAIRKVRG